ncbi:hypothetical protein ASD74_04960 [Rhizobium sp. Root564]|nr:hypothetical protein ASE62_09915 [Rhizobium sp. Leaf202]KQN84676.1 hypothetical protein ASF03_10605 [Rhizobium sp. Leaf68]KRA05809.1 hypothetical protein ASD74_04960 [Rhizobium sp. Root564]
MVQFPVFIIAVHGTALGGLAYRTQRFGTRDGAISWGMIFAHGVMKSKRIRLFAKRSTRASPE